MIDRLRELIGKIVFLEISNHRFYNGIITEVSDTHIHMTDKYNLPLFIAISEVKFIQEKTTQNLKSEVLPSGITNTEKKI